MTPATWCPIRAVTTGIIIAAAPTTTAAAPIGRPPGTRSAFVGIGVVPVSIAIGGTTVASTIAAAATPMGRTTATRTARTATTAATAARGYAWRALRSACRAIVSISTLCRCCMRERWLRHGRGRRVVGIARVVPEALVVAVLVVVLIPVIDGIVAMGRLASCGACGVLRIGHGPTMCAKAVVCCLPRSGP